MDINQEIQKATDTFIEQKLPAMVYEKVGKMVDGILDDVFRSYSETSKQIKAKIEEKLDINLQKFDLADYNAIVSKAIIDKLAMSVNENSIKPIMEIVSSAVGFIKSKNIKLSAIHEMVVAGAKEEHDDKGDGDISFFVVENDRHEWYEVSIDIVKQKSPRDCSINFTVNKRGDIFCFNSKNYFSSTGPLTPSRITMLSKLEHTIFRLYAAAVKVEIDETDFYNAWSRYDD